MNGIFDERRYLIPFRATLLPQIFTDVLVIGGGVAGMRAGLEAATSADVIIAGKGTIKHSNTYWAQGGIAVVLDEADSVEAHVNDTLEAGAGLCDRDVVTAIVTEGPDRIRELIDWGMRLDRKTAGDGDDNTPGSPPPRSFAGGAAKNSNDDSGEIAMTREGGHSHHRIIHTDGDATGRALAVCLRKQCEQHEHVRLFDECFVLDLITSETDPPQCLGAITHHPKYGLQVIWASATVLASGGAGMVYRETTNANVVTGDGLAMAFRAGAELMDMAFMQFHPTTLYVAGAGRSLITEAIRGEGAHLIDRNGYRFMPDYDPRAELAPRDIVSRSIVRHMAKTGAAHVALDVRPMGIDHFRERFPGIAEQLKKFEIDVEKMPIPVHPSAHYMVGGVRTDLDGRTNITGLYAAGEAGCTGLHGANRLASNSLLEGLVIGQRAGRAALEMSSHATPRPVKIISDIRISDRSELDIADVRSSLRSVMWRQVGIERDGQRLPEVEEMIEFWARYTMDKIFDERPGWELQNLLTVGAMITRAAAWRNESRGTHFRVDQPESSERYAVHDVWTKRRHEPVTLARCMSERLV